MRLTEYNRENAVEYAHKWAFGRNPRYYNYDSLGGDCTNFASQCLFAGSGIMDYTPTFGWYYTDANHKAPAWTGVEYLYRFLTRNRMTVGPKAEKCRIDELIPGDIVQLSFDGYGYQHSPVVVGVSPPFGPEDILIAAHTFDADYRPLSTYFYENIRFLHINGVVRT